MTVSQDDSAKWKSGVASVPLMLVDRPTVEQAGYPVDAQAGRLQANRRRSAGSELNHTAAGLEQLLLRIAVV